MGNLTTVEPPAIGKRLALFLDGTTDKSEGNTNVWRARCLCAPKGSDGIEQKVYYAAGVGTQLGEIVRGDVFGYGIDDQVINAYSWLVENYESMQDAIYIFGFSRGAFAARSLAGLISRMGLIKPGSPLGVKQLYSRYMQGSAPRTLHDLLKAASEIDFTLEERWMKRDCIPTDIYFTGVWDTVGSVPTFNGADLLTGGNHSFLDVNLRQNEKHVFHAMAIDENRAVFDANLLTWYRPIEDKSDYESPRPIVEVEQRWFCGAHGDVGGGTYTDALAQLPLKWLLSKASENGLIFKRDVELDKEAFSGEIEDTFKDFLGGKYEILSLWRRHWRPIGRPPETLPKSIRHTINETIDNSVFQRWKAHPTYRPKNLQDWAERNGRDPASFETSILANEPFTSVD